MTDYDAIRAGNEQAIMGLLVRLARQAVARHNPPPPAGHSAWRAGAYIDLLCDVFARRGNVIEVALAKTVNGSKFELYLLSTIENVLRDQGRETERSKLMDRLKTILDRDLRFARHTVPYPAWGLTSGPAEIWQGDIGTLVAAARRLRGIAVLGWSTSGPTPAKTQNAIVRVTEAALDEARGIVRDPDVATVVATCIPAVPLDVEDREVLKDLHDPADVTVAASFSQHPDPEEELGSPSPEQCAAAIWRSLDHLERLAVPHLASERSVASELELSRRTGAAVAQSAREKIRFGTTAGNEAAVVNDLAARAQALCEAEDLAQDPAGKEAS